ncbi:EPIDERMAL PATTERNING FACTOR-like protein 2 [Sesamum alatum]|uniref:Epidermal patterning factor-like protein n=1 Tax=Sesamum alatum TaxID=300844 RepID=A0AAE2CLE5_9LAMI|nr:EPIDERMAL PATTERNING FACTOR-like protein 2 [Sesamum alatum]
MGLAHNVICCHRLHQFAVSLLILLISTSSQLRLLTAEGRKLLAQTADSSSKTVNEEDKAVLRAQIGSRPPRCDGRCSSCGHCEAIQVPTNPQTRSRAGSGSSSAAVPVIAYARGDDNSNYKPMSWKCKCGNLIFNP